jgi:hypothetical protein
MRRALAMKRRRERAEAGQKPAPRSPMQSLSPEQTGPTQPDNPHEQGDTGNIFQNTSNRQQQR